MLSSDADSGGALREPGAAGTTFEAAAADEAAGAEGAGAGAEAEEVGAEDEDVDEEGAGADAVDDAFCAAFVEAAVVFGFAPAFAFVRREFDPLRPSPDGK